MNCFNLVPINMEDMLEYLSRCRYVFHTSTSNECSFQEAHDGRKEPTLASALLASKNVPCYIRSSKEMGSGGVGWR